MSIIVNRSGIQVGRRVVSDAFHVQRETPNTLESIASFWICAIQPEGLAEQRAQAMAAELRMMEGPPDGCQSVERARRGEQPPAQPTTETKGPTP